MRKLFLCVSVAAVLMLGVVALKGGSRLSIGGFPPVCSPEEPCK